MLSVWTAAWDVEAEASPSRRVVSGLSWGSLVSSVDILELAFWDTAREALGTRSELIKSFQSLLLASGPGLLLASVVATTRVEVSGSVDRLMASRDLLLVSVKVCVCSVSAEKGKNISRFVRLLTSDKILKTFGGLFISVSQYYCFFVIVFVISFNS